MTIPYNDILVARSNCFLEDYAIDPEMMDSKIFFVCQRCGSLVPLEHFNDPELGITDAQMLHARWHLMVESTR